MNQGLLPEDQQACLASPLSIHCWLRSQSDPNHAGLLFCQWVLLGTAAHGSDWANGLGSTFHFTKWDWCRPEIKHGSLRCLLHRSLRVLPRKGSFSFICTWICQCFALEIMSFPMSRWVKHSLAWWCSLVIPAKVGRLWVQGQSGLHSKTLLKKSEDKTSP